jgi:hypothetical protein
MPTKTNNQNVIIYIIAAIFAIGIGIAIYFITKPKSGGTPPSPPSYSWELSKWGP